MEVAHIDEQGRAVRVPQWIIDLEAPVDVTALIRDNEDERDGPRAGTAGDAGAGRQYGRRTAIEPVANLMSASEGQPIQPDDKVVGMISPVNGPTLEQVGASGQSYGI